MKPIDFDDPRNCVINLVKKVKRQMTRRNDQVLRKLNISSGHFSILTAIYRNKGIKATHLASFFEMEKSTVSRELKLLQGKELLAYNLKSDGRGKAIYLTKKGIEVYEKGLSQWLLIQNELIEIIGKDNFYALQDINIKLGSKF
jgi:DNA-binding MarR family transcriptional regulator